MTNSKELDRDAIVHALTSALEPLDYIYAFWEGGAIAFNRLDEWSDMDLYVAVDDDKVEETFQAAEKALKSLSPIKQKLDIPQTGWEGISQAFYLLENTSEYVLIDFCVLKLSSPDKLLAPEIHGNNVFYINKKDTIKPPKLDKEAFIKKLNERLDRLQARFAMFNNFVQKEINRHNFLEAIALYHNLTLASLTEVLRIKHHPLHYDFRMRYVHYELPQQTINQLKHLYFVEDEKDLQAKYMQATKRFHQTIREIDRKQIEKQIEHS